jgi:hypothetical protein
MEQFEIDSFCRWGASSKRLRVDRAICASDSFAQRVLDRGWRGGDEERGVGSGVRERLLGASGGGV